MQASYVACAFLLGLGCAVLAVQGRIDSSSFRAFYCAGAAITQGRDPYLVEPLRTCERNVVSNGPPPPETEPLEPAPLPGYALIPFAVLSRLHADDAAFLYALGIALAVAISSYLLAGILRINPAAILLIFTPLTLLNTAFGETPPLALLSICIAAYCLEKGRHGIAGIFIASSMVQPNVALPCVLCALVFLPRTRLTVLLTLCAMAIASVAAIGLARNLEYFAAVLPVQSLSELHATDQYGTEYLLSSLGFGTHSATVAGILFLLWTSVVVVLSGRLMTRLGSVAYAVLLPPGAAMIGVVYLHDLQIILALPAALLLWRDVRDRRLVPLALLTVVLLAVVWTQHPSPFWFAANGAAILGMCLIAAQRLHGEKPIFATALLGVMAIVYFAIVPRLEAHPAHKQPPEIRSAPNELAANVWREYIEASGNRGQPNIPSKLPTWIGLVLLAAVAARLDATTREPQRR